MRLHNGRLAVGDTKGKEEDAAEECGMMQVHETDSLLVPAE